MDAVNGSQLFAVYLYGGAGYADGVRIAPTFKIAQFNNDDIPSEKKICHNVASTFDSVSEGIRKINNRIQNVENNVSSNGLN